jgi:cell division protein FtsQ
VKRGLKIMRWLLAGAYLVIVLAFVEKEYEGLVCRGVDIRIHDSLEYAFIRADQVRKLISDGQDPPEGRLVSALNTRQMEQVLREKRAVKNAQVYTTVEGTLVAEVIQRRPLIRVRDREGRDFYLDREGYVIPAADGFTPHILLANGYIDGSYRNMRNVFEGSAADASLMQKLLEIAEIIDGDRFWRSQIVQVYVDDRGEFELIPRVGSHLILLGMAENPSDQFFKLKTLYTEGFSREGWNRYEIINLKYDRQVICTKR